MKDYPLTAFIGLAAVLDLTDAEREIDAARIARERLPRDSVLLLKTRNGPLLSRPDFAEDYVHLSEGAAAALLSARPKAIGVDYYSLDPATSETFPAHRLCARAGTPVFVCLDLRQAAAGTDYLFAGLPLNMPALEGAPVRAMLWRP